MAYGVPSSLVSQPGHAAYFVSSLKETADGKKVRIWNIGNAAAGWARSYKGERMLLDWGSKTYKWVDTNNAAYILIAQRALDEFDKYKEAFIYNLIAQNASNFLAALFGAFYYSASYFVGFLVATPILVLLMMKYRKYKAE